ncbi:MAG TPA: hypothetical protein VGQ36_24900 [Thermoanaerobaculia bacterium]|nr:hypothetical protein [Thermoanaerobaculia bacterium]
MLVILTIVMVFVAYTVPRMWSDVLRRDRERQTIFVMKQYARAIAEFQRQRGALPTTLEQLEEHKRPRVLRQLYPNPLTGKMDWLLVPVTTNPHSPTTDGAPHRPLPIMTHGPFIGVRPAVTGRSLTAFRGATDYGEWVYTIADLQQDRQQAIQATQTPTH